MSKYTIGFVIIILALVAAIFIKNQERKENQHRLDTINLKLDSMDRLHRQRMEKQEKEFKIRTDALIAKKDSLEKLQR